jgi:hypothetical protein
MIEYPLHFKNKPSGMITVPKDLSKDDLAVLEMTLRIIDAYAGPS